jgi:hypothetical protein
MAAIAKTGTPSLASLQPEGGDNLGGLKAGENLGAFDACYIASTGLVMRSTGAAANAAAKVRGYAPEACNSGEAVTLLKNVRVRYGAGLTPGADVFLSGTTAGGLDTAASTGGTAPIGFCVDDTRIHLNESRY